MTRKRVLVVCITAVLAFCTFTSAASAAELQLAGITLGRSALSIIRKYGNPSDIRVGAVVQQTTTVPGFGPGALPGLGEMGGYPFGMGGSEMLPSLGAAPTPGTPGFPFLPGMTGGPATPGGPVVTQRATAPEVTWIYTFPKNKTLEFIVNADGRVIQIAAYGVDWPSIRTSKGITLGHTYKDMVLKYGYPESHQKTGIEMIVKYAAGHRAVFTLVGKDIVGITIALMD